MSLIDDIKTRAKAAARRALGISDVYPGGGSVAPPLHVSDQGIGVASPALFRSEPGGRPRLEDGSPAPRYVRPVYGGDLPVLRASGPTVDRQWIKYVEPIPISDLGSPTGGEGTPWDGQIPAVESLEEMQPYEARGLNQEPGELERFYRGDDTVFDAVNQRVDMICGATYEWVVPEVPDRLAELSHFDRDRVEQIADYLNAEFLLNPESQYGQSFREQIHGATVKGFAVHEATIDVAAPLGRRLKLEHRSQSTVNEWVLDSSMNAVAIRQSLPMTVNAGNGPSDPVIDVRRCLFSQNRRIGSNWEGIADIRPAYFWKRLETEFARSALLHQQRFGPGFPIFRLTDAFQDSAKAVDSIHDAAKEFYYGRQAYLRLPKGVLLEMMSLQPQGALRPILEYCEHRKRNALGALVLGLGSDGVGSWALADVQSQLYLKRMSGFVTQIEEGHNHLARLLTDIEWGPQPVYPVLKVRGILKRSDRETIEVWKGYSDVVAAGTLDAEDVASLREGLDAIPNLSEEQREQDGAVDVDESAIAANVLPVAMDAPRAHSCDVMTRASGDRVTFRDRRGDSWSYDRGPVDSETHVAFRSLSDGMDNVRDRIVRNLEGIEASHRAEFRRRAGTVIDAGQISQAASMSVDFTDRYFDAVRSGLEGLSSAVASDMIAEVASQVGEVPPEPQNNPNGVGLAAQLDAQAMLLATQINDRMNDRLRIAAVNAVNGGRRTAMSDVSIAASFGLGVLVQQAVSATVNETRETVALAGPEVKVARYSAVLEGSRIRSCPECTEKDGTIYRVGSGAYEDNKPPNPKCRGFSTMKGQGVPCRCLYVYTFGTAEGETIEQGSDEDRTELVDRSAGPDREVLFVVGPPGAGKSTEAGRLAEAGATLISIDDLVFAGGQTYSAQRSRDAHAAALAMLGAAVARGDRRIVVDGPFISQASRSRAVAAVREAERLYERNPSRYSGINFKPPAGVAKEAARGLSWRDEHNRGGTEIGVARARDLSNRRNVSPDTIRRMTSYFARHEADSEAEGWNRGEGGYPSAGRIAWALWGGDAGRRWAEKIAAQMDRADESNPRASYAVRCVAIRASRDTVIERNNARPESRQIKESQIKRMWRAFAKAPPLRSDGFDSVDWVQSDTNLQL